MRRSCSCDHQARNVLFDDSIGLFNNLNKTKNIQNAIEILFNKITEEYLLKAEARSFLQLDSLNDQIQSLQNENTLLQNQLLALEERVSALERENN